MSAERVLIVHAMWDDEAKVWVATSKDVPGLVTEAATQDDLVKKLKVLVPELLDANGYEDGDEIPVKLLGQCTFVTNKRKQKQRKAA
jgi:predicted RNase H-like HicB family nuclease